MSDAPEGPSNAKCVCGHDAFYHRRDDGACVYEELGGRPCDCHRFQQLTAAVEYHNDSSDRLDEIEQRLDEFDQSHTATLDDVCEKLDELERAVSNRSLGAIVAWVIVAWLVFEGLDGLWHSKWRYSWSYSVDPAQVTMEKKPTDCDFLRAPLGEKECHYERQVSTVRVMTKELEFLRSVNYVSSDDGKTWTVDTASPPTQPQVLISWEKVEDQ